MRIRLFHISLILLLVLKVDLCAQSAKDNYSSSSVLSSGKWFKIAVLRDGIYRIDYSKLTQIGLTNPSNPKIYANNFGQLSFYNDDPKPDDLKEVAIQIITGSDGIFNEGDYLLFYGQGTGRWKYISTAGEYDFTRHNYSDTAFYFLTSGATTGKRITTADEPVGAPVYFSSESDALYIHEVESENLIKSGREWYQPVSATQGTTITPGFTDLLTNEEMKFRIRVLGRASVSTIYRFYEGSTVLKNLQVQSVNLQDFNGTFAQIADSTGSALPFSSSPSFEIKFFNNGESGAKGWLDFVMLQGRKRNTFNGSTSWYFDAKSASAGRITEYTITSTSGNPTLWDITDPSDPKKIQYNKNGNDLKFKASTDSVRSFVLFAETNAIAPIIKSKPVPVQNLHSSGPADMIIVTHPLFRKYAEDLTNLHLANSGLITQIVTPEEIYNEFSGGIPDIVAIRNYISMKFRRQSGTQHPLKYLLLFGDGSFENKTMPPKIPISFRPTSQRIQMLLSHHLLRMTFTDCWKMAKVKQTGPRISVSVVSRCLILHRPA